MTLRSTRHLIPLLAATFILAMAGCARHSAAWPEMDKAEALMESRPDSALRIIDGIDPGSLDAREENARYALLRSMALDKNYIDTTTFDILQPAIDYYPEHGTPDERLRTYYYQGVIHLNRKEDEAAMQSLMKAIDQHAEATDSLTLARAYAAEGTLFYNEYKIRDYVKCNLAAADLYLGKGKTLLAIKRYTNALDGYILTSDREKADSMLAICRPLVERNHEGAKYLNPSIVSYILKFGTPKEISICLTEYQDMHMTPDDTVDFARGYLKIGEHDKAMQLINSVEPGVSILDTLKYDLNKIDILDSLGRYKEAYLLLREYAVLNDGYHNELFSNDLLHADKRHQLEIDSLNSLRKKDKTIWGMLCGVFALIGLAGWLYYLAYRQKARRRLAEKENECLRLQREYLQKEKAKAEAEKKIAEAERLKEQARKDKAEADRQKAEVEKAKAETDRQKAEVEKSKAETDRQKAEVEKARAEADRQKAEVEKAKAEADRQKAEVEKAKVEAEKVKAEADRQKAEVEKAKVEAEKVKAEADRQKAEMERDRKTREVENLQKKVADLEEEQNRLKELEATQAEMARPVREAINRHLEMLNGLLRKEITNKNDHAALFRKWVEMVHGDRKEFMRMMRQAYEESHPGFIKHLVDHDLTDDEVGYLCLYAIGLRGNEIGDYIRNKRHYIMGSAIRKKLGLGEHDTNLGKYVRTLLEGYQL